MSIYRDLGRSIGELLVEIFKRFEESRIAAARIEHKLDRVLCGQSTVVTQQEKIMSEVSDLQDAVAGLTTDVQGLTTTVAGAVTSLDALETAVNAAGQSLPPGTLSAITTQITGVRATLAQSLSDLSSAVARDAVPAGATAPSA